MTELKFYKFFENKEKRWYDESECICWLRFSDLQEFSKLYGNRLSDDGGIDVKLQSDCVAIELNEVADYFGFDLKAMFLDLLEEER